MPFADEILAGNTLIRDAIQSQGYATGATPRWAIKRDGTADLQGATFRGNITFLSDLGQPPLWNAPITPAQIFNNFGEIQFRGPRETATPPPAAGSSGAAYILMTPNGGMQLAGYPLIFARNNGVSPGDFADYARFIMPVQIANTLQADGTIQSGTDAGLHTALNVNQLLAYNGAAASPLYLNWSLAGAVNIGSGGLYVNAGGIVANAGNITASSGNINATTGDVNANSGTMNSQGFFVTSGSALGTALIVSGGQMNASVSPPTTATAANATWVNTSGTNWRLNRFTSSRRYKENITDLAVPAERILALRPRTFQRNDHRDYAAEGEPVLPVTEATPWDVGFIAEEADELGLDQWVQRDGDGQVEGFAYATFVAAQQLVIREQHDLITDLAARVADLERKLAHV